MVKSRSSARAGFTLLEIMLVTGLLAFMFALLAGAIAAFRVTTRITGHETFGTDVVAINPDDTVASSARALTTEFLAETQAARFILCCNAPWTDAQASATSSLPNLSSLSVATLRDPSATKNAFAAAGLNFSGTGFTVWSIGSGNKVLTALTVTISDVTAPNGDSFRRFSTRLYAADASGYGPLLSYDFVSPNAAAQVIDSPQWNSGVWRITLPDPSVRSDLPDGSLLVATLTSGLVHDLVAHF